MKPLISQPIKDQKEKMQFVFDQAEKVLEGTVGDFDALTSKAFTLLCIEAGIISLLGGFLAVGHGLSTPTGWIIVLYAGFLSASVLQSWRAMESEEFFHVGRPPQTFHRPELNKTLPAILDGQCRRYDTRITTNRAMLSASEKRLKAAMSLFLWGTALSFVLGLVAGTVQGA